jgi:hypothetical protein
MADIKYSVLLRSRVSLAFVPVRTLRQYPCSENGVANQLHPQLCG